MPFVQAAQPWYRSSRIHCPRITRNPLLLAINLGRWKRKWSVSRMRTHRKDSTKWAEPRGPPSREGGKEGGRATARDIDHAPCTPIVHHFKSTSRVSPCAFKFASLVMQLLRTQSQNAGHRRNIKPNTQWTSRNVCWGSLFHMPFLSILFRCRRLQFAWRVAFFVSEASMNNLFRVKQCNLESQ